MSEILNQDVNRENIKGILHKYAQVLINISGLGVNTFSYLIPDELKTNINIGQSVLVSFGNKGITNAFIVGFSDYLPDGIKPKPILEILEDKALFDVEYLNFLNYCADYYCCSLQTLIETAIPMKFIKQPKRSIKLSFPIEEINLNNFTKDEVKILSLLNNKNISISYLQKKVKVPNAKFYSILRSLNKKNIVNIENDLQKKQKTQFKKLVIIKNLNTDNKRYFNILNNFSENQEIELTEFENIAHTTRATVNKLQSLGLIEIIEKAIYRNPLNIFNINKEEEFPKLSKEQQKAYLLIKEKIVLNETSPILLHGITGSGKTEIYFNLIRDTINKGKNILFLVPEIALASELTKRLIKRFFSYNVAIWHSSISEGERFDVWQKLLNNEINILVGARSAIFAPLKNIGLIVIDEEHESTYKQSEPNPRYNAINVAKKLAFLHNATLILGSATPDIVTYYNAEINNNIVKLNNRFNNISLPKVTVIDMRLEKQNGNNGLYSRTLEQALRKNLEDKKQSLILINRRGFATTTQCQVCGEVVQCKHCDIPLILHANENILKCHYCSYTQSYPTPCPKCGSELLKNTGMGVEKVEAITKKLFPYANVARLDSDILNTKNTHIEILNDFNNGKIDILVGTQMIAKGLDNKNVTVVGAINADGGFNLPDYRSAERGFQLLTQVAGRAGRGEYSGKVYFQTFNPEFYALENAKKQDYENFYKSEIEARELFDYPPFSQIITTVFSSTIQSRALKAAQEVANIMKNIIDKKALSEYIIVLGPSPCVLERLKNEYRFQIIIKNKLAQKGHKLLLSILKKVSLPDDIKLIIDVDPLDIL